LIVAAARAASSAATAAWAFGFYRAVFLHYTMAQRRELRATTARTSMFCLNDRSFEKLIQFIDEQPCALIRHVHRASRRRNRAVIADGFE